MRTAQSGTWSKIFYGCSSVTTALELQLEVHVVDIRKLLVTKGFTSSEISTVFHFLQNRGVVTVNKNIWSLNGRDFNLR